MLVKSNGSVSKLADELSKESKTNETLGRIISLLNDWLDEQKGISADNQIANQEICNSVGDLVKSLDKYFGREEKPNDTSVADAIKSIKFPTPQKIDFEPLLKLANTIEQQNKQHLEILNKISQPQQIKNDTSGYEALVRESLSAISRNSEAMRSIAESLKQPSNKPIEEKKPITYVHDVEYNMNDSIKRIISKPQQ